MNRRKSLEQLAALLDGEIKDHQLIEEFNTRLAAVPELKAEYEAQREVKAALSRLEEHEAPVNLDTRVLGEIARVRSLERRYRWRTWVAAAAGATACLAVVAILSNWPQQATQSPVLAESGETAEFSVQPGVLTDPDELYTPQDWEDLGLAEEELDPMVRDFLRFANDIHGYRVMRQHAVALSPDLTEAILVLERGDGE